MKKFDNVRMSKKVSKKIDDKLIEKIIKVNFDTDQFILTTNQPVDIKDDGIFVYRLRNGYIEEGFYSLTFSYTFSCDYNTGNNYLQQSIGIKFDENDLKIISKLGKKIPVGFKDSEFKKARREMYELYMISKKMGITYPFSESKLSVLQNALIEEKKISREKYGVGNKPKPIKSNEMLKKNDLVLNHGAVGIITGISIVTVGPDTVRPSYSIRWFNGDRKSSWWIHEDVQPFVIGQL